MISMSDDFGKIVNMVLKGWRVLFVITISIRDQNKNY